MQTNDQDDSDGHAVTAAQHADTVDERVRRIIARRTPPTNSSIPKAELMLRAALAAAGAHGLTAVEMAEVAGLNVVYARTILRGMARARVVVPFARVRVGTGSAKIWRLTPREAVDTVQGKDDFSDT